METQSDNHEATVMDNSMEERNISLIEYSPKSRWMQYSSNNSLSTWFPTTSWRYSSITISAHTISKTNDACTYTSCEYIWIWIQTLDTLLALPILSPLIPSTTQLETHRSKVREVRIKREGLIVLAGTVKNGEVFFGTQTYYAKVVVGEGNTNGLPMKANHWNKRQWMIIIHTMHNT